MAYYAQNIKLFSHFGNFYFIQPNIFQFQKHIEYEAQPLFGACTFWVLLGVWVGFLPSLVLIDQLRFLDDLPDAAEAASLLLDLCRRPILRLVAHVVVGIHLRFRPEEKDDYMIKYVVEHEMLGTITT